MTDAHVGRIRNRLVQATTIVPGLIAEVVLWLGGGALLGAQEAA